MAMAIMVNIFGSGDRKLLLKLGKVIEVTNHKRGSPLLKLNLSEDIDDFRMTKSSEETTISFSIKDVNVTLGVKGNIDKRIAEK
jgi:hypothetical protein